MTNKRLAVFTRSAAPPPFRLTYRDIAAVELVHRLRFVTAEQVHKAVFDGERANKTYAEHRLKLLFQHGYLTRVPKPSLGMGAPKAIYCLENKGRDLIADRLGVPKGEVLWEKWDNKRSFFFLEHTIALNDLRLNLTIAAKLQGHELVEWRDERELRVNTMRDVVEDPLGGGVKIPIVPDGWGQIELSSGKRFSFFVELDRCTEDRKQFTRKVRGYLAYWETGAYVRRYETKSLTVLTVVAGERAQKRVSTIRSWTEGQSTLARPDTFSELFWFTTLPEATPGSVLSTPIWQIAGQNGVHNLLT